MRQVVLISGHICTGKSELAHRLKNEFGYRIISTSDTLKGVAKKSKQPMDRIALQALGDDLDEETKSRWLLDAVIKAATELPNEQPIIVDNVRTWSQLQHFRITVLALCTLTYGPQGGC